MFVMLLLMLVGIAVLVIFIWALVRWLDRS